MTQNHAPAPAGAAVGFALSATGAMFFAGKGVLIKLIYRYGLDTTTLLGLRMILSVPVFAAVAARAWARMPAARRPGGRLLAQAAGVGIIGYYVSSWLDFRGLVTLDAQTERLILFTYPFLTILFGRLLLGQPFRAHALVGAAMSYAGIVVMFAGAPTRLTTASLTGGALVLMAATTFAIYQLLGREMIVRLGAGFYTGVAMTAAGVPAIGAAVIHGLPRIAALPAPAWALIVTLVALATVLPAFLMSAGLGIIGAQATAIISTLSPIVTVLLAVFILREPFGWPETTGTVLVLGGAGMFGWLESRRRRLQPLPATVADP